MKIIVCFLFLAILSGVLSDTISGNGGQDKRKVLSKKRDIDDQTGIYGMPNYRQTYQLPHFMNQYAPIGQYVSATTPQVYYTKPDVNLQYVQPSNYRLAYTSSSQHQPQIAFAATVPTVKMTQQPTYSPVQLAYAPPPTPIQYTYSPNQIVGHNSGHYHSYAIAPQAFHRAIQFAYTPSYQHGSAGGYLKSGGSANYNYPQQFAVIAASPQITKSYSAAQQTAVLAAPPPPSQSSYQPQIYHQPTFTYSIQPSIQVASAKQILAPTASTQQFRASSILKQNESGHPGPSSFSTYSQHISTPTVASTGVAAQPSPTAIYSTASTPVYSSEKYSYAGGPMPHPSEPTAVYTHPSAVHYGTHLYHPSGSGVKIATIGNTPKYS